RRIDLRAHDEVLGHRGVAQARDPDLLALLAVPVSNLVEEWLCVEVQPAELRLAEDAEGVEVHAGVAAARARSRRTLIDTAYPVAEISARLGKRPYPRIARTWWVAPSSTRE